MTPELEVLEQIVEGSLPLSVIVGLFPDLTHFKRSLQAMIRDGQVILKDPSGDTVLEWQLRDLLSNSAPWQEDSGFRLHITDRGAEVIG